MVQITTTNYQVRKATLADLPRLVEIEKERWGRIEGTPSLSYEDLFEWFEADDTFFFVAEEKRLGVTGYMYSVRIDFDLSHESLKQFTDSKSLISHGIADTIPNRAGNGVYSISVTSLRSEGAHILHQQSRQAFIDKKIPYIIGLSRLGGFKFFWRSLLRDYPDTNFDEMSVAKWYAEMTIYSTNGTPPPATPSPTPPLCLRRPDPVLAYNVQGLPFRVISPVRMMPNDTNTRGLGAFIVSEYPHKLK